MAINPKKLSGENLSQLALDLDLEEVDGDIAISPEEAVRRSETARLALKERLIKYQTTLEKARVEFDVLRADLGGSRVDVKNVIGWADEYYRLQDYGWPWRVAAYIAWASSPKAGRYPRTQEELSTTILGLTSDRQISTWRRKNPAIDETIGLMQAAPLMDHRRDAFEALAESAADPSFHNAQDRKTFFVMTTDYVPHQRVDIERPKTNARDYTAEELDRAAAALDKKLGLNNEEEGDDGHSSL